MGCGSHFIFSASFDGTRNQLNVRQLKNILNLVLLQICICSQGILIQLGYRAQLIAICSQNYPILSNYVLIFRNLQEQKYD